MTHRSGKTNHGMGTGGGRRRLDGHEVGVPAERGHRAADRYQTTTNGHHDHTANEQADSEQ